MLPSSYGQSLTPISQDIPVGGRLPVDTLFGLIEGSDAVPAMIAPRLMVRASTGRRR